MGLCSHREIFTLPSFLIRYQPVQGAPLQICAVKVKMMSPQGDLERFPIILSKLFRANLNEI